MARALRVATEHNAHLVMLCGAEVSNGWKSSRGIFPTIENASKRARFKRSLESRLQAESDRLSPSFNKSAATYPMVDMAMDIARR